MIKGFVSGLNKLFLHFKNGWEDNYLGGFFLVRIKKDKGNILKLKGYGIRKSVIQIAGTGNALMAENALIENSEIVINGKNNTLHIAKGVKLRKANIIIRGSNSHISIGEGTTFGGVRIINVGESNRIDIGKNCLFSDHIEVWASDTHSIFNEENVKINTEKPIHIGDNVWLGSRVIVLKGVQIGEGAIVGMGTLVSKEVPPKSIVVGNPNRVVKSNVYWTNEY